MKTRLLPPLAILVGTAAIGVGLALVAWALA